MLALTDGIAYHALVLAEDVAVRIYVIAASGLNALESADKACVVAVGDEAYVLTVGLVGVDEPCLLRQSAYLRLFEAAEREQRMRELLLRERVQHVGLVLAPVGGTLQQISSALRVVFDYGVVSRRDVVVSELLRAPEHSVELDAAVALDTRIRRPPADVALREMLHDVLAEAVLEIENEVLETELPRNIARVEDVRKRTAGLALLYRLRNVLVTEHFQRHARDLVALVSKQHCRNGAVNSAAHADHNLTHYLPPQKVRAARRAP